MAPGQIRSRPLSQSLTEACATIREHYDGQPKVALILGSGLGSFVEQIAGKKTIIAYDEIPGMPEARVPGHAGQLVFAEVDSVPVVVMQGRSHLYEGYSPQEVVFGVRLMLRLGAQELIVTNAAGGLSEQFSAGDLMIISDHINFTGKNCLAGPNDESLGTRFPDMTCAYDPHLASIAEKVALDIGLRLRRGVYAGVLGPCYETPAEIRMFDKLGAHAVGMSTVQEVIAARHMGVPVLGISCITNMAAGISGAPLSHGEVAETADRVKERFGQLLFGVIRELR
ncbi:MAG: purine-nucleoside phosphorylase [Myxococcales bacterium]|nr:MAG: purine-nucleoside phosphorylase [Myxococcales bacterium]